MKVYKLKLLKSKGAVLIVIWTYLATTVFHFLKDTGDPGKSISSGGIILVFSALFYPVGGWVADRYIGRYKMVRFCTWIMWIGAVFLTISEILAQVTTVYGKSIKQWVMNVMFIIMAIGLGGFQSNIIQLGVDQLIDASSAEITSFITWYVLALYASGVTLRYSTDCITHTSTIDRSLYISSLAVVLYLSLVLCSDFFLNHWLVKERVTGNSFGFILKVVKYTIKNRKHRYTFTEDEIHSVFDIAKYRYGGPFTTQQVEEVKSFLRILILIATCTIVCGGINLLEYANEKVALQFDLWMGKNTISKCYKRLTMRYSDYLFAIAMVLLYEFVVYPLWIRCLPRLSINTRFLLGTVFFLLWVMSLLGIEIEVYTNKYLWNSTTTCIFTENIETININYKWLLIPRFMSGVSTLLFILSGIEFIWAQAPYSMTGLIFGTMYAFLGLNTFIQAAVASPFLFLSNVPWKYLPLTCSIWYFILQSIIVSGVLVIGAVLFKKYKQRNRNNN